MRVFINEAVCEGCGDCGVKSNCLSVHPVETEFGRKTQIHQSSCNKDYSCLQGDCPSFLTVVPLGRSQEEGAPRLQGRARAARAGAQGSREAANVFMMGIGGTGVVTVNQILGTAALLDGKHVRGLDQTGLSQKGGPVVSHLKILDRAARRLEQGRRRSRRLLSRLRHPRRDLAAEPRSRPPRADDRGRLDQPGADRRDGDVHGGRVPRSQRAHHVDQPRHPQGRERLPRRARAGRDACSTITWPRT